MVHHLMIEEAHSSQSNQRSVSRRSCGHGGGADLGCCEKVEHLGSGNAGCIDCEAPCALRAQLLPNLCGFIKSIDE